MATMMRVPRAAWEAALRMANGIYNIKQASEVRRSQLEQLGAAQVEFDRHKAFPTIEADDNEVEQAARVIKETTSVNGTAAVAAAIRLKDDGWFRAAAVSDEWRGPIPEVQGTKPLVLYFQTDEDRQGFADLVHAIKPKMIARAL